MDVTKQTLAAITKCHEVVGGIKGISMRNTMRELKKPAMRKVTASENHKDTFDGLMIRKHGD